jgi:hypothetical protein
MAQRSLLSVLCLLLCGIGTGPVFCSGHRLAGSVSDPDGRPISGLPLWVVTAETPEYEEIPPAATTGPDGSFEILHLASGEIDLHACGQGYLQQSVTLRVPGEPVHLILQPAATLSGRVVKPDGAPLAGTEVFAFVKNSLDPDAPAAPWTPCPRSQWATSDAAGLFTVGPLAPGLYELRVKTDDLLFGAVHDARATAGELTDGIEIRLASLRAGALAGRVLDRARAPIAGAHVTAVTETSYETATSAADGSYRFENVGRGRITLRATAPGYEGLERETELDSAETWLDLFLDVPEVP